MNIVEREGISFAHPSRYILVGTMNPEEGDLRPQLLDRFALSVEIHGLHDLRERMAIIERNLAFEGDPERFRAVWMPKEDSLSREIEAARLLVEKVTYSKRDMLSIAALTSSLHVDGHRADLVILKAARAHAALEGRTSLNDRDIALAAELALPHRLRRGPFHQTDVNPEELQARIEEVQNQFADAQPDELSPADDEPNLKKSRPSLADERPAKQGSQRSRPGSPFLIAERQLGGGRDKVKIGTVFARRSPTRRPRPAGKADGAADAPTANGVATSASPACRQTLLTPPAAARHQIERSEQTCRSPSPSSRAIAAGGWRTATHPRGGPLLVDGGRRTDVSHQAPSLPHRASGRTASAWCPRKTGR
jgi:hypothetical protein